MGFVRVIITWMIAISVTIAGMSLREMLGIEILILTLVLLLLPLGLLSYGTLKTK